MKVVLMGKKTTTTVLFGRLGREMSYALHLPSGMLLGLGYDSVNLTMTPAEGRVGEIHAYTQVRM